VRSHFRRELHNPLELMRAWWPDADLSHITYNPKMKRRDRKYWRIEQAGGDGTLAHSVEMMQKLFLPLMNKTSYYLPDEPSDFRSVKDIRYAIGPVSHATVFGYVELRCGGEYPGQRERVRMPVISTLVF